ncbi:MAG: type II toxin-antitoxin system Phd/YefM family antitoxin [Azoarcus sp.]|jgi:prevent-host-death family protein|nr:type II toxin-antitoxin system Phd/YefM family antitoxin [Azoarcus sp.]
MRTVSASEAKQGFATVIDAAMHEPIMIQRQKRDIAVVMSVGEYKRLVHLNVEEFQRFCDQVGSSAKKAGLTERKLAALLSDGD